KMNLSSCFTQVSYSRTPSEIIINISFSPSLHHFSLNYLFFPFSQLSHFPLVTPERLQNYGVGYKGSGYWT
ncbi:MAG: hypothetical protein QME42_03065, partial [bacterium]|nr:hypothetical protein [bacterium]